MRFNRTLLSSVAAKQLLARFILLYAVISSAYLLYLTWPFSTDDAYITFRYALHLYQGHGLLWNIGGHPVEGYTNFLYVVFAYLSLCLKLAPILFVKVVNVIAFYLSLGVLYRLARLWLTPVLAALCVLVFSFQPGIIWWTVSGLETITYTLFVLSAVYYFFVSVTGSRRFVILSAVFSLLAALTRSDGIIVFAAICCGYFYLLLKKDEKFVWRDAITFAALFLVPFAVCFLWRWHYFGELLPNSAYCKKLLKHANYSAPKFQVMSSFSKTTKWYLLFSLVPVVWRFNYRVVVVLVLLVASLLIYYDVDPVIAYLNRYFIPVLGFIFILSAVGLVQLTSAIDDKLPSFRQLPVANGVYYQSLFFVVLAVAPFFFTVLGYKLLFLPAFLVAVFLFVVVILLEILGHFVFQRGVNLAKNILFLLVSLSLILSVQYLLACTLSYSAFHYHKKMELRGRLASYLTKHTQPHDAIFLGDVGLVGYRVNRPIIDAYCINNFALIHGPAKGKMLSYFPYLLKQVKPKFIVLMKYANHSLVSMRYLNVNEILQQPYFVRNYKVDKVFAMPRYTNTVYVVYKCLCKCA